MKTIAITALALIGGFFAGLVLSEIIGIIGFFLFDKLVGFQLLHSSPHWRLPAQPLP